MSYAIENRQGLGWINLRQYNRGDLKQGMLRSHLRRDAADPELLQLLSASKLVFDSLCEGHGPEDFELALTTIENESWFDRSKCYWLGNTVNKTHTENYFVLPYNMVNHCSYLDHVVQLNIDWQNYLRDKMFVCLIRRPSETRAQIAKRVLEQYQSSVRTLSYAVDNLTPRVDPWTGIRVPILLDGITDNTIGHRMNEPRVWQCLANCVVETSDQIFGSGDVGYTTLFLTEKTFKVFAWHQIGLWFAVPGTVSEVRRAGFDVFDDWVDHSYDDIEDQPKRFDQVFDQLDRLIIKIQESGGIQNVHQQLYPRFRNNYLRLFELKLQNFKSLADWKQKQLNPL